MRTGDVVLLERLRPDGIWPENPFGYLGVVENQAADGHWVVTVEQNDWFTLIRPNKRISANHLWRLLANLGQL